MTTEVAVLSPLEEMGPGPQSGARATACAFCKRRLANEYFFTCRKCESSFCYIHMSRHGPALCGRHAGRRRRAEAVASVRRMTEDVPLQGGNRLLLAGQNPGGGSSANV